MRVSPAFRRRRREIRFPDFPNGTKRWNADSPVGGLRRFPAGEDRRSTPVGDGSAQAGKRRYDEVPAVDPVFRGSSSGNWFPLSVIQPLSSGRLLEPMSCPMLELRVARCRPAKIAGLRRFPFDTRWRRKRVGRNKEVRRSSGNRSCLPGFVVRELVSRFPCSSSGRLSSGRPLERIPCPMPELRLARCRPAKIAEHDPSAESPTGQSTGWSRAILRFVHSGRTVTTGQSSASGQVIGRFPSGMPGWSGCSNISQGKSSVFGIQRSSELQSKAPSFPFHRIPNPPMPKI